MNARSARAALVVLIGLLIGACSTSDLAEPSPSITQIPSPPAERPAELTQTSDGGEVTVVVTWAGPAAGLVFDVVLDTHSVDLDAVDLADAVVWNDRGETLGARPWAAPAGGHHRQGTLVFEGDVPAFLGEARWVELQIKGVGDLPERTLRWDVDT
ncbi:MAG: hypothetical protein AABZ33_05300 [Chloroflexota bacterium]